MPPESIRDRAYSEKSDVWAFGVVIYEIVTGKEPFEGMDLIEVAMQIRDQQLTLAKYLPTNGIVQDYLVELMKMCWSQAPADRPSFREIGAWLESNAPSRDKKGADDYANDVIAEPPVANESSREPELETKRRKKRKEARGVTAAVSGGTNYTSVDL
jgi:serine/threonine protein kinase